MRFQNRTDAGIQLAEQLMLYGPERPIVIALPRGGVPVGYQVAHRLGAELDIVIARKLGAPGHSELGIGAVAQGGAYYLNADLIAALGVPRSYVQKVAKTEMAEVDRRVRLYRGDQPPLQVQGRTVIVVDDGLATGSTMRAVIRALQMQRPQRLVLAVPVCAPDTAEEIAPEVDDLVCVAMPEQFTAVGAWYRDFAQTTDEEVIELLAHARRETGGETRSPEAWPRPGTPDTSTSTSSTSVLHRGRVH